MAEPETQSMIGKICVVTGGTLGIGMVTARELARLGAEVVIVGHDPARGQAALESIRQETASQSASFIKADLSSQAQVRRLAEEINRRFDRVDVLLNNAGGVFIRRQSSIDHIEMTFALNHLSPFLLTNLLLERLKAAPRARIINVSSAGHQYARIDFDNLNGERGYSGWEAYSQSKLANLLFTYELARRLKRTPVTANALHPGFVASHFGKNNPGMMGWLFGLSQIGAISPEEGARTSIYLAASPRVEGISGKYFVKCKPVPSSDASYDPEAARLLWQVSEELTGLSPWFHPDPESKSPDTSPPAEM